MPAKAASQPTDLPDVPNLLWEGLARECGLTADQHLADVPIPCGSWLASEGGLQADLVPADVHRPTVGVSLLAMAA